MDNVIEFFIKGRDLLSATMRTAGNTGTRAFNDITASMAKNQQRMQLTGISITDLNSKLDNLRKTRDVSIDFRQIRAANAEITRLEQRVNMLKGGKESGGGEGGSMFGSVFGGNIAATLAMKAVAFAKQVATDSIDAAMQFGFTAKTYDVLTGSPKAGRELTGQLQGLKQETIMGASVYKNAQTLMGFGIDRGEVVKDLREIGDIAMGNKDRMEQLTLAFSQTRAAGKLMGQDLLQYINAGFNPLNVMAEHWQQFGLKQKVSIGQLKDAMSEGKISAGAVAKAFEIATSKGGMFYNMMNQVAETPFGKSMKLEGKEAMAKIDLGNWLMPYKTALIDAETSALHFLSISKSIPESMAMERAEVNTLVGTITGLNGSNEMRLQLLETLKNKYPDLFGKIETEKASNSQLLDVLRDVNKEYERKMKLASYDLIATKADEDIKSKLELAQHMYAQDTYEKSGGGPFKYLGLGEAFKAQFTGRLHRNLKDGADELMNDVRLLGLQKQAAQLESKGGNMQQLLNEAYALHGNRKKETELWGKDANTNDKALVNELGNLTAFLRSAASRTAKGLIGYDTSRMDSLLHGGVAAAAGINSGINSKDVASSADSITGGGQRVINIINNKPIFDHLTYNVTGGVAESQGDLEKKFDDWWLRTLATLNAAN